jgi:hypothetical protein
MHAGSATLSQDHGPAARFEGLRIAPRDHLVALYEGETERHRLIYSFVSDGLDRDHRSLCLASHGDIAHLLATLRRRGVDDGLLEVERLDDGRAPHILFDVAALTGTLHDWSARAFQEYECLSARAIVDLSWAASCQPSAKVGDLTRFGRAMADWARIHPQVGVSMYDLTAFGGGLVPAMVSTHARVWIRGTTVQNPYAAARS